jgi:hypothetical protein
MSLWTPAQLPASSLGIWYDVSDTASLTLNSGNIAQIADKSGNGRHGVQTVAANQPILNASAINGRPAMQSTAGDRWLTATRTGSALTAGAHFLVFRMDSTGFVASAFSSSTNAFLRNTTSNFSTQWRGNTIAQVNSPNTERDANFRVGIFGFGPADVYRAIDGTRLSAARASDVATLNTFALLTNAGNPTVGAVNGLIGEYLFIEGDLTLLDQQRIEGYLAWKWGLQANLPLDHPYRTFPPDPIEGGIAGNVPLTGAATGDIITAGDVAGTVILDGAVSGDVIVEGDVAGKVPIIGRIFGNVLTTSRPSIRFTVPPPTAQQNSTVAYSFTAPLKDPQAILDYEMDWTAWLGAGELLVQPAQVAAPDGVTITFERIEEGKFVRWRMGGGVAGDDPLVTITIDTNTGQRDERTIRVPVRDR